MSQLANVGDLCSDQPYPSTKLKLLLISNTINARKIIHSASIKNNQIFY